jgi:hypothetical protein
MTHVSPSDFLTRRVCLRVDGMEGVPVRRDLAYAPPDGGRTMDVYSPSSGDQPADGWPAVIIVSGFPGARERHPPAVTYKDIGWTVSMCQLVASSGMAAIAYTNRDPAADLSALLDHLHASAGLLQIDAARTGIIAVSGNVPTALTPVMQDAARPVVCAVFGYGCLLDLDDATEVADAAREFGFANPGAGRTMADLRRDVPLLVIRAGRDQFPAMNRSIDSFVLGGLAANLPMTLVNHAEGSHAFDLFDDSRPTREILRQALRFLRHHLTAEGQEVGAT